MTYAEPRADVLPLPLPDDPARERIRADLESNLLVEAGAGSGKTTELVARMVALLETGAARADELAAVTFTRKAAGELRVRFQTAVEARLAKVWQAGGIESAACERLAGGLDEIDRVFIGTIHAFCARLLRERPLEIGLDPGFEEMELEERDTARRRFWQSYLERLARESDPILEDLARAGLRPLSLYPFFEKVVENPDVDFRVQVTEPGTAEELRTVREALEDLVDRAWELMPDRMPDPDWDRLQQKFRSLHFSRDVTGWNEPSDVYEAIGMLCKSGTKGHDIVQKRWRNAAQAKALKQEVDAFGVGDTPARKLHLKWLAHRYSLSVRLVQHAATEFAVHRRRIGKLDFQDLLVLTADLLRSNANVRRDLGARYRRLLVDEFQDTDPLQAEIMFLLASDPEVPLSPLEGGETRPPASEWTRAIPRSGALFVVGDPKQSIYRFRRADIQLYGFVKERFAEFGGVVTLTSNFRSRPAIGDLVNQRFREYGFFPNEATPEQAAFEPLNTRPPTRDVAGEGVFFYEVSPSQSNATAAAREDAARVASWIRERVDRGERPPSDFLILTHLKARIDVYARALEEQGLPVAVTGAGIGLESELRELQILLHCLIDPGNPVSVLAALVGLFFGLDYERLVAHRLDGGELDAMRPGERGHPDVLAALRALHGWWLASAREPADVFVPRLVSDVGLLPLAAAGELGAERAGALMFALDSVRAGALAGDASLPGAVIAIEAALSLSEAEAPLEPARTDVVRVMNLHQAKGLESPVVVLVDPSGGRARSPEVHVERTVGGSAIGYARVPEVAVHRGGTRDLARPVQWDELAAVEERYAAAEDVRLLYVAVTRAKEELVVARWPAKEDDSFWRPLHEWLDERGSRLQLEVLPPRERVQIADDAATHVEVAARMAGANLETMRVPTYVHKTVTVVVKSEDARWAPRAPSTDPERPPDELRGFSWGSAVHGALAVAARAPGPEELRATCRDLLVEYGRPVDDHGEPIELDELAALVQAVQASRLWSRASRAEKVMAEVPFSLPNWRDTTGGDVDGDSPVRDTERPQLDLFGMPVSLGAADPALEMRRADDPPIVLEGVIDLAFLEPDGWVVADYKTDVGTDPDFPEREDAYRRQVDLYAAAWAELTGERVKERVLFFTSQGREERW